MTSKSSYGKVGTVNDEKVRVLMRDTAQIRRYYDEYIEKKRIKGYMNLYKVIMKTKPSLK